MNIDDFKNHPYRIEYDEEMELLIDSIRRNGLINPLVVRKKGDDRYEMISGHRRKRALEALMMYNVDAYIYDLSDDVATIMMVDSNLHRENILLSEKVFAYKMRYDAMKHQGRTSGHNVPKKNTADEIGAIYGESGRTGSYRPRGSQDRIRRNPEFHQGEQREGKEKHLLCYGSSGRWKNSGRA